MEEASAASSRRGLAGVNEDMDDASLENMRGLLRLADQLVSRSSAELDAICRDLLEALPRRPPRLVS